MKHGVGVVGQGAGDIDVLVEVHTHHGLELPQREHYRTLRVIDIGNRVGQRGLGPGQVEVGGTLRVVLALSLLKILKSVLIDGLVDLEGLLGQKT